MLPRQWGYLFCVFFFFIFFWTIYFLPLFLFSYFVLYMFCFYLLFPFFFQIARCRADEFECASGSCVSKNARCDGRNDCVDHSDEYNCNGIFSFFPFHWVYFTSIIMFLAIEFHCADTIINSEINEQELNYIFRNFQMFANWLWNCKYRSTISCYIRALKYTSLHTFRKRLSYIIFSRYCFQ